MIKHPHRLVRMSGVKSAFFFGMNRFLVPGTDEWFMWEAFRESRKALKKNEVPIGAVVVKDGRVIARGWNQVETLRDATAHAEMLALTAAQAAVDDWRLEGCTLYVTKEPCPMCAGAIVHCRPDRVVFGCPDSKSGAAGGWINLLDSNPPLNHKCEVVSGVLGDECTEDLRQFFRQARQISKERKLAGLPKIKRQDERRGDTDDSDNAGVDGFFIDQKQKPEQKEINYLPDWEE